MELGKILGVVESTLGANSVKVQSVVGKTRIRYISGKRKSKFGYVSEMS